MLLGYSGILVVIGLVELIVVVDVVDGVVVSIQLQTGILLMISHL